MTSDGVGDVCFATEPNGGTSHGSVVGVVDGLVEFDVEVDEPLAVVLVVDALDVVVARADVVVRFVADLLLPLHAASTTMITNATTAGAGRRTRAR
jgi:hypothetical protein